MQCLKRKKCTCNSLLPSQPHSPSHAQSVFDSFLADRAKSLDGFFDAAVNILLGERFTRRAEYSDLLDTQRQCC